VTNHPGARHRRQDRGEGGNGCPWWTHRLGEPRSKRGWLVVAFASMPGMRIPAVVYLGALTTSAMGTIGAIAMNVATSSSPPPPLAALRAYSYPVVIGLWLVTAVLQAAQERSKHQDARLTGLLGEPARLDAAIEALRGRLDVWLRRRIQDSRVFRGLPALPQAWHSDPDLSGRRAYLAHLGSNPDDLGEYVRTFDRVPAGRLVVCGAGGVGKTNWLLSLARGLVESGDHRRLVPVVLDLSTWPTGRGFARWVTDHLVHQFPELRASDGRGRGDDLVTRLLEAGRLVLLLDGLDEVAIARRGELLAALNDGLWQGQAVVLTTRTSAYPPGDTRLRDAAVIVLDPLPAGAGRAWLTGVFTGAEEETRWKPVLRALDDPTSCVATALSTPLVLTLAAKVYEAPGSTPGDLVALPGEESVLRSVFGRFTSIVYTGSRWGDLRARGWLEYLATRMHQEAPGGIAWWGLYRFVPRWRFALLLGAFVGLVTGLISAGLTWLTVGALPAHVPLSTTDYFLQVLLVFRSLFESAVSLLSGQSSPDASVVAVTIGALCGAVAAVIASGLVLGYPDRPTWRRVSWIVRTARRGVREAAGDLASSVVLTGGAGLGLGALTGAFVGLAWSTSDHPWVVCLLALSIGAGVGVLVGVGVGLVSGAFNESISGWGHPAPDAPTAIGFAALRPFTATHVRGLIMRAGVGFAVGAALGLITDRQPGLAGGAGALLALFFVGIMRVSEAADTDAARPADAWATDHAVQPRAVLRADVLSSVVRLTAIVIVASMVLVMQPTAAGRHDTGPLVVLVIAFFTARELCMRSWSWSLVAAVLLAARGRLPWRTLRFLEDARDRSVLRRDGGTYRFRHAVLAAQLANTPLPEHTVPDPPEANAPQNTAVVIDLDERNTRAAAHRDAGHHLRAAIEFYRQVRTLFKECPPQHTALFLETIYLAGALHAMGWFGARRLGVRWGEIACTTLPRELPEDPVQRDLVIGSLLWLADVLGDPVGRLFCLQRVRGAITEEDPQSELVNRKTLILREWRCRAALVSPQDKAELLTVVLADACATLEADHRITAIIRHSLTKVLVQANRLAEAEHHYQQLAAWSARHPDRAHDMADAITKGLATTQRRRRF
jgi:NACHT domain